MFPTSRHLYGLVEGLTGRQGRQARPGLSRDCSGWTVDFEKKL